MADLGSSTINQTDASNASGTMPSWSGTAAPSTLDDAGRALQGAVAREWNWRSYTLTASGTNTKTLTYSVAPAAYYNGQRFSFLNGTTVTGSTTLNVNSLGAKTIKKMVSGTATDLASGDMVGGAYVEVAYNTAGDYFVWTNFDLSTVLTTSSGNLGIGASPSFKLDVQNNSSSAALVIRAYNANSATSAYAGLQSGTGEGVSTQLYSYNSTGWAGTTTNHDFVILADNTEYLRVKPGGNTFFSGDVYLAQKNSATLLVRNLSSTNRIDSYDYPITATYPLQINSSVLVLSTADTERVRITNSGGVAFGGASNYGTAGQYLKSAGNSAPVWTSLAISDVSNLQTSLDAKAPLASPSLTGTPTAPTAADSTNTTQIATTAFVQSAVGGVTSATTANVLSATAGASSNAVGTYGLMSYRTNASTLTNGDTVAASGLRFSKADGNDDTTNLPSGSWRCMGYVTGNNSTASSARVTLFLRYV